MKIYVDIDDTICFYNIEDRQGKMDYSKAKPYASRITKINKLYDEGHKIIYWTARGTVTQKLWFNITYEQLKSWGCKFHELKMGKPAYDLFIDDKNINSEKYFNAYDRVIDRLIEYKPDFLIFSAGFDAHKDDPLAQFELTSKDFYEITKRTLRATNKYTKGKVLSVLEGGYDLNALAESAYNHVMALSEKD